MKTIIALLSLLVISTVNAQVVLKENLTKKVNLYWDFNKTQLQATGSYYKDEVDDRIVSSDNFCYCNSHNCFVTQYWSSVITNRIRKNIRSKPTCIWCIRDYTRCWIY